MKSNSDGFNGVTNGRKNRTNTGQGSEVIKLEVKVSSVLCQCSSMSHFSCSCCPFGRKLQLLPAAWINSTFAHTFNKVIIVKVQALLLSPLFTYAANNNNNN